MSYSRRRVGESKESPEVVARFSSALGLVDIIARQILRTLGGAGELEELLSFGREGLWDAARRFDDSRGVPFRGYANFRVRGAIIDGVRSSARLSRRTHERLNGLQAAARISEGAFEDLAVPRPPGFGPAEAEVALADHLAAMATAMAAGLIAPTAHGDAGERTLVDTADTPEQAVAQAQLLTMVRDAIAELPHEEAELVRRHYLEGARFDHVATELGLSKSWASRLHTRALSRLARRLRGLSE
ncbi:MAG TPA: sigma-70 family RNA polymerase sigma factor [Polyangiaceae bacterium]|nr:sigma-70 family RNA polymerase sigma factor [Polyangiaceae bacterium]